MSKFSPEASPRRRRLETPRRIGQRILVVCGSLKTEDLYLKALKSSVRNAAMTLKVYKKGKDPLQVVDYALQLKARNGRDYDAYWVVFDVDEFDIFPAVRKARKNNVEVAVSNPCFELWLILHFQEMSRHLSGYKAARDILRTHLPDYAKNNFPFSRLEPGVEDACRRAIRLEVKAEKEFQNPTTGVCDLVLGIIGKKKTEI